MARLAWPAARAVIPASASLDHGLTQTPTFRRPQTAAGRQAVAGNALRTGAYAAQGVLPGEDPAHFQELEQQFLHDFAPADVAQSALVHQPAVITWKKLRLDRREHSNYLGFIHREFLDLELARCPTCCCPWGRSPGSRRR